MSTVFLFRLSLELSNTPDTGQSNLPASCPVCEHSPLSAEDCSPNKSLRTTIKVFLRTAEKKREASRAKEGKESEPATPVEAAKPTLPTADVHPPEPSSTEPAPTEEVHGDETPSQAKEESATDPAVPLDQVNWLPGFSVFGFNSNIYDKGTTGGEDVAESQQDGTAETTAEVTQEDTNDDGPGGANELAVAEKNDDDEQEASEDQEGYNAEAANGGMSNTNFSGAGDMNQMQMMMAMQNGMQPFGNFSMMGTFVSPFFLLYT